MHLFRNSSIRHKLILVVLCTGLLGLGIAGGAFELYERVSFRRGLTEQLTALAETMGANSAASLAFEDRKSAQDVLAALRPEPHIVAVCLFDRSKKIFAQYRRPGMNANLPAPVWQEDGARFSRESLTLYRTILLGGQNIGTIAIVSDLTELRAEMRQYTEISAVVLVLSVFTTLLVSSRLLRLITEPIQHLANVAGKVSRDENYTLRAVPRSDDEVGKLIHSFNDMLERIQERDTKLKEAKDDLELRVEVRTKELKIEVQERERAQEALSEERGVLRALIDNVPDYMYVKDAECRFLVANLAVARQMGAETPDELLGKTDYDFYPPELAKTFFEDEQRIIHTGQAEINREEAGLDPQGNVSQVLTTQVPLRDKNGRATGLVGIGHDITHLKKIQAEMQKAREVAEAASQAKSEFLANMSHEIRTPLNGIMGMTDLALDTVLTQEQREYLRTVKFSADSLLTVINDILDFSKIEAGKIDLENANFDLRDAVETALKTLAVRADERGLELLCDVAPEVPEMVRGDATRLRQVLLNLLGNAIKFTHEGEVALKARLAEQVANNRDVALHFTVSDTGIGIPQEKQQLIFDPFSQADTSTTRKYGGTGLGLTISTRLVQMMGGRIWVESEEGHGSHFHFTARMGVVEGHDIKAKSSASLEDLRGVRALLVDDNETNLRILEGMLKRWEMHPVSARSGDEALAELAAGRNAGKPYGLIVTDMHMPRMDGFELVEHIRERRELSAATIMMLTSAGHRGDADRCQKLGVSAYLLKPIRQSELREAIARVLGAREREPRIPLVTRFSLGEERVRSEVLRILVAEDNAVNQRLIVRLLEKRGHRVVVAGNGKEAVAALEKEPFDLVMMDMQMPEMDGFEATAAIRKKEKNSRAHQIIIALTAHAMKSDREKCLEAGMDGYLTKPIQPPELDEILAQCGARQRVPA